MMTSRAGWYRSPREHEELLVIFRVDTGWYWQRIAFDRLTPQGMVNGPYLTDETAYQSATQFTGEENVRPKGDV